MKKQQCDVETIEDFQRYYRYAFIGLARGTLTIPAQVSAVGADSVVLSTLQRQADGTYVTGEEVINWQNLQDSASFGTPSLGLRTVHPSLVYLYITPTRHWNRGYQPERTFLHAFNHFQARSRINNAIPTTRSREVTYQVFEPTYFQLNDLVEQLNEGTVIGGALNDRFGLYTLPTCPHPLIAYKRKTIGYMEDGVVRLSKGFKDLERIVRNNIPREVRIV